MAWRQISEQDYLLYICTGHTVNHYAYIETFYEKEETKLYFVFS